MSSPIARDVTSADFQAHVIERSHQVPVLVDFWAAWCGPCRMLGPVLEKVAADSRGLFELVKVDTDANPNLAGRYQIRGIPAVKLFVDGAVADEFVGALPEAAVRAFIAKSCPSEADKLVAEAATLSAAGENDRAAARLRAALEHDAAHPAAHLQLARLALAARDADEVERHLDAIGPLADEADAAQHVRAALQFLHLCRDAGGASACRARLAADDGDLDARLALGACLAVDGDYRAALDELLAVVAKDKRHRDEAARKAMLTIFGIVGVRDALSDEYRNKLSIYL